MIWERHKDLPIIVLKSLLPFFLKKIFIYLEKGEGKEKERERNTQVREKH